MQIYNENNFIFLGRGNGRFFWIYFVHNISIFVRKFKRVWFEGEKKLEMRNYNNNL